MIYTRSDFGKELASELDNGFDVTHTSRWAYSVYLEKCGDFEAGLDDVVLQVVAMEEGPEFEFTEAELRQTSLKLQGK